VSVWNGCRRRSDGGNGGARDLVPKSRLVRLVLAVQREPKAGKKPRMEAKIYKTASKK